MKKYPFIILIFLFGRFTLFSQDIHFSQYNGSLLNLSHANTGFFDGDYRANLIFRKQWQAVPVPYTTISMSVEGKFNIIKLNKQFSYGLLYNNDKSGDARYTIHQIYLNLAYLHKLNQDSTLLMNTGISFGYANNAFDYSKMTFDAQFNGLQYNSNAPTNENFNRTSLHYWDFNIGTFFKYLFNQKMYAMYSINLMHINNPVVTYYANYSSKIDKKVTNYLMFQYPVNQKLFLLPEILFSLQGKYKEFLPGAQVSYLINNLEDIYGRVGLFLRARDAIVFRIGLDYQTTNFGISYDINTSKFVAATNSRGGFEMYLIHIFKTKKNYLTKKKPCPVFL